MGVIDQLKKALQPYGEERIGEEEEDIIPARPMTRERVPVENSDLDIASDMRRNKVVNIHATTQLQVVLVKPDRFDQDQAAEVADNLRDKRTVVLNLESASKEISRRILDFVSGVAYALDGKIQKIANSTYIVTPFNVEIMGDLIDELENNGLYF